MGWAWSSRSRFLSISWTFWRDGWLEKGFESLPFPAIHFLWLQFAMACAFSRGLASGASLRKSTNGRMLLAEGAPDLMLRLSRFPSAPQLAFLHRRKPKPLTLPH